MAESLASVSKDQLRRMNLLRTSARDKIEHRNVLYAHYLNKEPGLERVFRALALHRQKASSKWVSQSYTVFSKTIVEHVKTLEEENNGTINGGVGVQSTKLIGIRS